MHEQPRNIRIKIAYDGTRYAGWQVQENDISIQGTIEDALRKIHKHDVKITGAGRTDSGVHAKGQVANFKTDIASIPAESFKPAINSYLPEDIRILKSDLVPFDFNSRYDAKIRRYKYYLSDNKELFPWQRNYCLYLRNKYDIKKLNEIASAITGVHDFSAFSSTMEEHVSKIREIYSSVFYSSYPFLVYKIEGTGFLRKMVRSIVGTIFAIYNEGRDSVRMREIMETCDRRQAGPAAPAQGLFLDEVIYNEENT